MNFEEKKMTEGEQPAEQSAQEEQPKEMQTEQEVEQSEKEQTAGQGEQVQSKEEEKIPEVVAPEIQYSVGTTQEGNKKVIFGGREIRQSGGKVKLLLVLAVIALVAVTFFSSLPLMYLCKTPSSITAFENFANTVPTKSSQVEDGQYFWDEITQSQIDKKLFVGSTEVEATDADSSELNFFVEQKGQEGYFQVSINMHIFPTLEGSQAYGEGVKEKHNGEYEQKKFVGSNLGIVQYQTEEYFYHGYHNGTRFVEIFCDKEEYLEVVLRHINYEVA